MGLDTSHGCWNGPYSAFMRWRIWLAKQEGIPLQLMEGFYGYTWGADDLPSGVFSPMYDLAKSFGDASPESWFETLRAVQSFGRAIPWSAINSPLVPLLHHSDCDGNLSWTHCLPIARRLRDILRVVPDDTRWPIYETQDDRNGTPIWTDWRNGRAVYDGNVPATKRFMRGCLLAHRQRENVRFR